MVLLANVINWNLLHNELYSVLIMSPDCLQHASVSPDGKLFVVVGDSPNGLLVDYSTEMVLSFSIL